MVRVASVGGCRPKVTLVEKESALALDGVERPGEGWRPVPVELPTADMAALEQRLAALEPVPSALQVLLNKKLGKSSQA